MTDQLGFGSVEQYPNSESAFFIKEPKVATPHVPQDAKLVRFSVDPKIGLQTFSFMWAVPTDIEGKIIRRSYLELRNMMTKKYGNASEIDRLQYGNVLMEEPLFFCSWFFNAGNKYKLIGIIIEVDGASRKRMGRVNVSGNSDNMAQITVKYEFEGSNPFYQTCA